MSQKYDIGDLIEKGNFSEIYKCINKMNSNLSAGKKISLENYEKKNLSYIYEENILKCVNHQNIIKYKESFSDDKDHYIITDYYPNGNLYNLFRKRRNKFNEFEIKNYLIQMVNALIYLKQNNIIHRDIKPHHFVISDDFQLKLCGFHLARKIKFKLDKIKGNAGTPNYMAPEIVKNENYSFEVDVWSLGVTIYVLSIGNVPFIGKTRDEVWDKIKLGQYSFPSGCNISDSGKDLIQKMLIMDPSKRIAIEEIPSHDFLQFGIPASISHPTLKETPQKEFVMKNSQEKYIIPKSKECDEECVSLKNKLDQVNNLLLKEKNITQMLSNRVKLLEGQLKIEKNKVNELNEKNKEMEKIRNNVGDKDNVLKLMDKLLSREEEIREMKSRYPFEILEGEKLISVIFMSYNQEIHYSVICKDSDKFTNVENLLYDEFPKYRETENYFVSEGNKINKYKTLKENSLKNGSIIVLYQMDEEI
jgi:serine/threonine protein kinase